MADVTEVSGSRVLQMLPGMLVEFFQVETAANGEDGVTFTTNLQKIKTAFVCSNEDGKTGPFTVSWSGATVTVKAIAGAPGDAATVSVICFGH